MARNRFSPCVLTRFVILLFVIFACLPELSAAEPTRFEGLGTRTRKISTQSAEAQVLFDQGLAFAYGFNHAEAIKSFEQAAKSDPNCAAIYWANALVQGPHINFPMMDEQHVLAASAALAKAQMFAPQASPVERDLIAALAMRYANPQPEDRKPLDVAYAAAMGKVWQKHPRDADVGALFAESLMDLWPWDLWSAEGAPRADTAEVLRTLDAVLALEPNHPLALHLYVHAMEASQQPEKAAAVADRLRDLQPGLGHMVHMPSHIDVRLGLWQQAIEANEKAIAADTRYREQSPEQDFFRIYMAHNRHMLAFAAIMQGQNARATESIRLMLEEIPASWLEKNAPFADGMFAMPYEVHLRFGRWDAMLAEPEPKEILPIARIFWHYARGVALAAKSQVSEAKAEQQKFLAAKTALPETARFVQNTAADVFGVAEKVLEGEILYRDGKRAEGIAALREGVRLEDALRYIEPPDWLQPVRHILGAALMDDHQFAEAEKVYRQDLKRHPNNGWSLHGLARSLKAQGKLEEFGKVNAEFQKAWERADVKLTSSCFCLPGE